MGEYNDRVERDMDAEAKEHALKRKLLNGLMMVLAVVMIVMVITYLFGEYEFTDILKGIVASDTVSEDLTLTYQDYTVHFSPEAYDALQKLYMGNIQHEFAACLMGVYVNNTYAVTDIHVPDLFSQSVFEVVSGACNKQTIIRLHSHPYRRCVFSPQDIFSYQKIREHQGNIMLGLMCEPTRFSFYRED